MNEQSFILYTSDTGSASAKIAHTAEDGKTCQTQSYNLDGKGRISAARAEAKALGEKPKGAENED